MQLAVTSRAMLHKKIVSCLVGLVLSDALDPVFPEVVGDPDRVVGAALDPVFRAGPDVMAPVVVPAVAASLRSGCGGKASSGSKPVRQITDWLNQMGW